MIRCFVAWLELFQDCGIMDGEDVTARSSAEDLGELSLGSAEWPPFGPHTLSFTVL